MRTIIILLFAGVNLFAQGVGVSMHGADVAPNTAATNGGYLRFAPIEYNPFDSGSVCHDVWGNKVQQPMPTGNLAPLPTASVGENDLYLWSSLSPSMPFTSGSGSGLVQPLVYNDPTATGPCGVPLPVNLNYGLNTNGYIFPRGGVATDQTFFNSIQSLQGGVLAGSFTAGIFYVDGTTICTSYNGTSCTATAVIGAGVCPGGGSGGCYLGGHEDVGHSKGPPASGGIGAVTNPFTGGEGAVAGQLYFEDGTGVYPTFSPCLRVYDGAAYRCVGAVSEVYNSFADQSSSPASTAAFQTSTGTMKIFANGDYLGQSYKATTVFNSLADTAVSPSTTAAFQTSGGTMKIFGSGDFQGQTYKATTTFNSLADTAVSPSTTAAFQTSMGTMVWYGSGDGRAQSLALTHGITVDSGAYGLDGSGVLTVASCTGCGSGSPVSSWNTRTGAVTLTASDVATVEQDLRTSASPTFAAATAVTFNCTATATTLCVTQSGGTWGVTGGGDYKGQTYKATTTFNSLADTAGSPSTTAAFQTSMGTMVWFGSGDGQAQSLALTHGITVDSGAYGLDGSGVLTVASCSGCGTTYSAGTGVSISGGVISIGQAVATSSAVSLASLITSGSVSSTGTLYALADLSVSGVAAISTGIIDSGYLQVQGHTGVTSSTCSHFTGGICDTP